MTLSGEKPTARAPTAVLRDGPGGPWLLFGPPRGELVAAHVEDVPPRLGEAARRVEGEGLWAVGWVAYEAAPAFDPALAAHPPGELPPLRLTLHDRPEVLEEPPPASGDLPFDPAATSWTPSLDCAAYLEALAAIRRHLADGDTYQVNYTLRLRTPFDGDPYALFLHLAAGQGAGYATYLAGRRWAVACASPELFFELDGHSVTCRPMKGTAPRGRTLEEDEARARALVASAKERAENVMIVDMIRNDLGRVARPGTVRTERLFAVERYPTVLQMTSTVGAETDAGVAEIFAALFPCASITGAPKVATSRILARLEPEARGVYTGAVGYLAPGRRARWSVAIRTAVVDRRRRLAEFGVGGGIVADSDPRAEWREARLKGRVLTAPPPPVRFRLLETLRWDPEPAGPPGGFRLLKEHLERLGRSAAYFGFPWDRERVRRALEERGERLAADREGGAAGSSHKLRLLLDRDGGVELEAEPLTPGEPFLELEALEGPVAQGLPALRLVPVASPVDAEDVFLFHKTTHRRVYEEALQGVGDGADDALLWNRRGELTETTRANLLLRLEGGWLTPPVASGLLAGTYRARLLAEGRVEEAVLSRDDLARAQAVAVVNSVRGARRVEPTSADVTGETKEDEG